MKNCILSFLLYSFLGTLALAQSSSSESVDSILLVGKQHLEAQEYRNAAVVCYNASLELSLNEVEQMEDLCLFGIKALEFIDDQYLTRMLHLRLAESYLYTSQKSKTLEIEEKILSLNIELLTRDFYGAAAFYQQELLTQRGIDKKNREIEEENQRITNEILKIKSESMGINLPQGDFYTESFDHDGIKKQKSIAIRKNEIEVLSEDSNGNTSRKRYLVERCYKVDSNASILSVAELSSEEKHWNFIVLISENQVITLDHSNQWDNNEMQQDSLLYVLLNDELNPEFSRQLTPGFEEYYSIDRFTQLTQLPVMDEEDIADIRTAFLNDYQDPDDPDNRWYKNFILGGKNDFEENNDVLKRGLKNILVKKGFHPFRSTPFFLLSERTDYVNSREFQGEALFVSSIFLSMYFLSIPWVLSTIKAIALCGLIWICYNLIYELIRKKRIFDGYIVSLNKIVIASPFILGVISVIFSVLGTLAVTTLGAYLGCIGGWNLGHSLGYSGGASIINVMYAIIGTPIGGILGFFFGIYLNKIRSKKIYRIKTSTN